jgi:hypothetical protein
VGSLKKNGVETTEKTVVGVGHLRSTIDVGMRILTKNQLMTFTVLETRENATELKSCEHFVQCQVSERDS